MFAGGLLLASVSFAQTEAPPEQEDLSGASPAEAEQIFSNEFSPALETMQAQAQPLGDAEVIDYRGDFTAVIAPEQGVEEPDASLDVTPEMFGPPGPEIPRSTDPASTIAMSSSPLRAEDDSGDKAPLDLTLEENASGDLTTANAVVAVAASPEAAEGVTLGSGADEIAFAPDVTGETPEGRNVEDLAVMYPEVATDADLLVSPVAAGVEVFVQIRSAEAPEDFDLDFDLPSGAVLDANSDGTVAIVDGQERIGQVSAALTLDAEGDEIESSVSVVDNDTLRMTAEHRSPGTSYPALLDPMIDSFSANPSWSSADALWWRRAGWWMEGGVRRSDPSDPARNFYARKQSAGESCWSGSPNCYWTGLYVFSQSGRSFKENEYAGFTYSPPRYVPYGTGTSPAAGFPGTTAYVSGAAARVVYNTNGGGNSPHLNFGVFEDRNEYAADRAVGNSPITRSGDYNGFSQGWLEAINNSGTNWYGTEASVEKSAKQVWMQLSVPFDKTTSTMNTAYLYEAHAAVGDDEYPLALPAASQTDWIGNTTGANQQKSMTISGHDKASLGAQFGGLGIYSLGVDVLSANASSVYSSGPQYQWCTGTHAAPCQVYAAQSINYPVSGLADGVGIGVGRAQDATLKPEQFNGNLWWIKIDRQAPTLNVTGGLRNTSGTDNDLTVTATDSTGNPTDPLNATHRQAWRSGIESIKVLVDGVERRSYDYSNQLDVLNAGPQQKSQPVRIGPSFTQGQHTFKVIVKDRAGHTVTDEWTRNVAPPDTTITKEPIGFSSPRPTFEFVSSKPNNATFECSIDGGAFYACTTPHTVPQDLPQGPHRFDVRAIDAGGVEDPTPDFSNFIVIANGTETEKLGLEQYFHYDSTETGLSGAHANLATGNLVWHSVPMVNPGRGLSSFLNLTYNSYDYPLLGDLPPIEDNRFDSEYDEFGLGFSGSISGITRMNEPLSGLRTLTDALFSGNLPTGGLAPPGSIQMSDPDGTRHAFEVDLGESTLDDDKITDLESFSLVYKAPAGVDLRLRTYDVIGSGPRLEDKPKFWAMTRPDGVTYFFDAWGFLRSIEDRNIVVDSDPNQLGNQPRAGNELRYVYERVLPATGQSCTTKILPAYLAQALDKVCEPRLAAVVDPAGVGSAPGSAAARERSFEIDYFDLEDLGEFGLTPLPTVSNLLDPSFISNLQANAPVALHSLGKVESITDHGKVVGNDKQARTLDFTYDGKGFLVEVEESSLRRDHSGLSDEDEDLVDPRSWEFEYDDVDDVVLPNPLAGDPLDWPQMVSVEDPKGAKTIFTYEPNNYLKDDDDETLLGDRPKRRIKTIVDRNGHTKRFSWYSVADLDDDDEVDDIDRSDPITEAEQEDAALGSAAVVKDGRAAGDQDTDYDWQTRLDSGDRPVELIDPLSIRSELEWTEDDPAYEDNGNRVEKYEIAAGGDDSVTTDYTYNANGQLRTQVEAAGTDEERTTELFYCDNAGVHQAPPVLGASADANETFVSDLTMIDRPLDGSFWKYELDNVARLGGESEEDYCSFVRSGSRMGRQTAQIDPMNVRSTTEYDSYGQITKEVQDAGSGKLRLTTTYADYDKNGMPGTVVDPRGNEQGGVAANHTWSYRYDEVGNLINAVDPRGLSQNGPQTSGDYTTSLGFDGFDRLIAEEIPKDSVANAFIERNYTYDQNDNQKTSRDGANALTTVEFTSMDRPETATDAEGQTTGYLYDKAENLTGIVSPKGYETFDGTLPPGDDPGARRARLLVRAADGDFMTRFHLDRAGRRVATEQLTDEQGAQDLITSYSYDDRGNVTGVAMPQENSELAPSADEAWECHTVPLAQALENAAGENQRYSYEYSEADNLELETEDPPRTEEAPDIDPCGSDPSDPVDPPALDLETEYGYDDNDNRTSVTDPRDFETTMTYDGRDDLIATVDPLGGKTTYERRNDGLIIAETSPRGNFEDDDDPIDFDSSEIEGDFTTKYTYDANGDLTSRSVPFREGQYELGKAELENWKITYDRDEVGNPETIRDARGNLAEFKNGAGFGPGFVAAHTFENTFYDDGSLRSTERPDWWQLDWSAGHETPDPGKNFAQTDAGLAPDLAAPQGGPTIAEAPGSSQMGPEGSSMSPTPEDLPSGPTDFGSVQPEEMPDFLPRSGEVELFYDGEMRLSSVSIGVGDPSGDEPGVGAFQRGLIYDNVGRIKQKSWGYDGEDAISHGYTYDKNGNLSTFVDGEGTERDGEAETLYTWGFDYDQFDRRVEELSPPSKASAESGPQPARELTGFEYFPNGTLAQRVLPRIFEGNHLTYGYGYDAADRLTAEVNPSGDDFAYGYDAAGNLTSQVSPVGNETEISYDAMGRQTSVVEGVGSPVARTTTTKYDIDGNPVEVRAPGSMSGEANYLGNNGYAYDPAPRVTRTTFDGRGLPWATTSGYGTDAERTTVQEFDPDGNLRRTVNPKGIDPTTVDDTPEIRDWTPLPHDDDPSYASNEQDAAADSAFQATVGIYNADQQLTSIHLPTSDEAPSEDLMPPGDVPAAYAAADDVDDLGPPEFVKNSRNQTEYRQTFGYDEIGRIASVTTPGTWGPNSSSERIVSDYEYYDTDWIKTSIEPAVGSDLIRQRKLKYRYDRRGIQTLWETPTYRSNDDLYPRTITRDIFPSGLLASRTGEKANPDQGGPGTVSRTYTYDYNEVGSLIKTTDVLPQDIVAMLDQGPGGSRGLSQPRVTFIQRDAAERQLRVNETFAKGRDSAFSYNDDGTTLRRWSDGRLIFDDPQDQIAAAPCTAAQTESEFCTYDNTGKTTKFEYDDLEQETLMLVTGPGTDRVAETSHWPSGDVFRKRRLADEGATSIDPQNPDLIVETNAYDATGLVDFNSIDRPDVDPEKQDYTYDLNGNRTTDERGTHAFNARDQLVLWERGDEQDILGPAGGPSSVSYVLNGSGASLDQYDNGVNQVDHTHNEYLGDSDRLKTIEATDTYEGQTKTTTSTYYYDEFGNVRQIHTSTPGVPPPAAQEPPRSGLCETEEWTDPESVYYCYDQFERLVRTQTADPDGIASDDEDNEKDPENNFYIYDGLDRRDFSILNSEEANEGSAEMNDMFYVGMSELMSREQTEGSSGASNYDAYDYDSTGERIGQVTTESGTSTYHGYGKDANGSVTELESEDGEVADDDRYIYDPYGNLEDSDPYDESTPDEGLSAEAQANPFRFEGFYYDSGVETYDMRARAYQPGMGRFLSQDRFAAAAGDLQLQSDPLTQNRFAFAGGNPVSNIEFDGHCYGRKGGRLTTRCRQNSFRRTSTDAAARRYRREKRQSPRGQQILLFLLDPGNSQAVGGKPASREPLAYSGARPNTDADGDGPIPKKAPAGYLDEPINNQLEPRHNSRAGEAPDDIEQQVSNFRWLFGNFFNRGTGDVAGVVSGVTGLGPGCGCPTAVDFMDHYFDGGGDTKAVDVDQAKSWSSQLRNDYDSVVNSLRGKVGRQGTDWTGAEASGEGDIVLGGFSYRIRGRTTALPGGGTETTVTTQLVDRYDFPRQGEGGYIEDVLGVDMDATAHAFDAYGVAQNYLIAGSETETFRDP